MIMMRPIDEREIWDGCRYEMMVYWKEKGMRLFSYNFRT